MIMRFSSLPAFISGLLLTASAAPVVGADYGYFTNAGLEPVRIVQTVEPRFPTHPETADMLEGEARIIFNIDAEGKLVDWLVASYTHPAFAEEAVRSLQSWRYEPARRYGEPVGVRTSVAFNFVASGKVRTIQAVDTVTAFTTLLNRPNLTVRVAEPAQIDRPVEAVTVVKPGHPAHPQTGDRADLSAGRVLVDFYIDEEGRPRMPVVLDSDDTAFALSAVNALSLWRYTPPTRDGEPVAVRAQQQFVFTRRSS